MPENTNISLSRRNHSFISNSSERQLPTISNATETTSKQPIYAEIFAQLNEFNKRRSELDDDDDDDDGGDAVYVEPGARSILSPRQRSKVISADDDTRVNASSILQTDPPILRVHQLLPPPPPTTAAEALPLASTDQVTEQGKSDLSTTHDSTKRQKISPITAQHSSLTPVEQPSAIYPNTFQARSSQLPKATPPLYESTHFRPEDLVRMIKAHGVEVTSTHHPYKRTCTLTISLPFFQNLLNYRPEERPSSPQPMINQEARYDKVRKRKAHR